MPPPRKSDGRKSDGSVVVATPPPPSSDAEPANDDERPSGNGQTSAEKRDRDNGSKDAVSIEDLSLPKSIITRLAKGVLPPNTQIQANAILAMSKGATVFISYLASHANEYTTNAGKKTISPADVFKALDDTEFSFLREPLEAEFAKFNAVQTEKRSSYRQKVRAAKDAAPDPSTPADETSDRSRGPKRPRIEAPSAAAADTDAEGPDAESSEGPDDVVEDGDEDDEDGDEDDNVDDEADDVQDEDDEDDEDEDDEDEDDDADHRPADGGGTSGDDTQDADEALDGDESD
ncbi:hypothetical protein XA68_18504 [Ophiocordyceps unilateralis]|uniref:DNA polymerase epsilon subunit D n=1 Tax=Ophiocordyceps unilateralis TaxID=268505 RepID=A0A2A9P100_OPHUN|nr:hypothetical protein XA68_18504 [Ophiocordyceps unilateralis]